MKILLDTQVFLWMTSAPERISRKTRELLTAPRTDVLLSSATPWEIAIKVGIGKLILPCDVEEYVETRSAALSVTHVHITYLDAIESANLPAYHRDPFDRILIAQARIQGVPILTADRAFDAYDVEVLKP